MRKALLVGVGGTGVRVAQRLRELVEWRKNVYLEQLPFLQMLGIDSDKETMTLGADFVYADVSRQELKEIRDARAAGRYRWLDDAVLSGKNAVDDGAGAVRMIGKLTFLNPTTYEDFFRRCQNKITTLDAVTPGQLGDDLGLGQIVFDGVQKIYVVGNLVSGTGSGATIDVGYGVKRIIRQLQNQGTVDDGFEVTGLFTLPDDIEKDDLHAANAYQALEEMNHYFTDGVRYWIEDPMQAGQVWAADDAELPFDFPYLLSVRQGAGVRGHGQLEDLISEFIYTDVFLSLAARRDGRRADIRNQFMFPDRKDYPRRFMSFGMSTIEYPLAQIARGCTYRFLVESINHWFSIEGTWNDRSAQRKEPKADPPYHQLTGQMGISDGDLREHGTLPNRLTRPITVEGREFDIVGQYEALVNNATRNYSGDPRQLERVEAVLRDGFEQNPHGDYGEEDFPRGIVHRVIQQNVEQLLEEFPGNLQEQCARLLFGDLSWEQFGPQYVGVLLEKVQSRIAEIKQEADEDAATGTLAEISADALEELRLIREDPMLAGPGIRSVAQKWAVEKYQRAAISFFDAMLMRAVHLYYEDIAEDLDRYRKRLTRRLVNFEEYVTDGLRLDLIQRYKDETDAVNVNGIDPLGHDIGEEIQDRYDNDLVDQAGRQQQYRSFVERLYQPNPTSLALDFAPLDEGRTTRMDGRMAELGRQQTEEGQAKFNIPAEHERDLVRGKRGYFVSALTDTNVINVFSQNRSNHGEAVTRAGELAAPFIALGHGDPAIIENRAQLRKSWYAYPGGDAIDEPPPPNTSSEQPTEWFAGLLGTSLPAVDWDEESVDSDSDQSIVFWRERGAFPIRQITMLDKMEQQKNKRIKSVGTAEETGVRLHISRVDVDFQPLSEDARDVLVRAELVFFVAVATGVLAHNPQTLQFTAADTNWLQGTAKPLPEDHREAGYQLYQNPRQLQALEDAIDQWRTDNAMGNANAVLVQRIHQMLSNPPNFGLNLPADQDLAKPTDPEYRRVARLVLTGYVAADDALRKEWERRDYDPSPLTDRTEVELRGREDDPTKYPTQAFYCTDCGLNRGLPRDSQGNPDPEALEPMCPRCARTGERLPEE